VELKLPLKKSAIKGCFLLETNIGFSIQIVLFHCSMCLCCNRIVVNAVLFFLFAYPTVFIIIIDRVAAGTCHGFAVGNFFLKAIVLSHCTILEGNDLFRPM